LGSPEGLSEIDDYSKWISLLILTMSYLALTIANMAFAKVGFVTLLYYFQTVSSAISRMILDKSTVCFNTIKINLKPLKYTMLLQVPTTSLW